MRSNINKITTLKYPGTHFPLFLVEIWLFYYKNLGSSGIYLLFNVLMLDRNRFSEVLPRIMLFGSTKNNLGAVDLRINCIQRNHVEMSPSLIPIIGL